MKIDIKKIFSNMEPFITYSFDMGLYAKNIHI